MSPSVSAATRRKSTNDQAIMVDKKRVPLTNVDKVLWPHDGYTKGDLVSFYHHVSSWLLPYLEGRPLTLQRFPNGIGGMSFFEKDVPRGAPSWIKTVKLPALDRTRTVEYILCNDEATLLYVANLASITLHVWTSKVGKLDLPDFCLFDLDPVEGCSLETLASVAIRLHDALDELGIKPLVKTTGGKGLHVIVPLVPKLDYDAVKGFAEVVTRHVADVMPGAVTLERSIKKRPKGRVYLDWVQVGKGKTVVPPFVIRARDGAPVSMPLGWQDVRAMTRKKVPVPHAEFARWNISNVPSLLRRSGDPWKAFKGSRQALPTALRKAQQRWTS